MKKFLFTLEALLVTCERQEAEIKKELIQIDRRLEEERFLLECLLTETTELRNIWRTKMAAGVNPMSLSQFDQCFNRLREQQESRKKTIEEIESERTMCQSRLRKAMTETKALSNLKEGQLEAHMTEATREMEKEIDEWVTGRKGPVVGFGG